MRGDVPKHERPRAMPDRTLWSPRSGRPSSPNREFQGRVGWADIPHEACWLCCAWTSCARISPVPKESASTSDFRKSVAREYLESIVVALMLALFIRTFIVQAFKIPSSSMESNLLVGDHLLVNKLVYSPSWGWLEDRLLAKREVRRGHVVIFKFPDDPERDFIKRVIGLPGETVEIRDKAVYINGEKLDEPYTQYIEPLIKREDPAYGPHEDSRDNWGPHPVPQGALFVMGDNRDNSHDSRFWVHRYLPRDQVKGRALMVYWSYEAAKGGDPRGSSAFDWVAGVLSAPFRTRWGRFFHVIR